MKLPKKSENGGDVLVFVKIVKEETFKVSTAGGVLSVQTETGRPMEVTIKDPYNGSTYRQTATTEKKVPGSLEGEESTLVKLATGIEHTVGLYDHDGGQWYRWCGEGSYTRVKNSSVKGWKLRRCQYQTHNNTFCKREAVGYEVLSPDKDDTEVVFLCDDHKKAAAFLGDARERGHI